ncbi:MAG TPA: nucleoside-diphosphate kinase [Allosphingosinicella sp.]|uniref:GreA/GreB family elongation factor n=1 Tax=Allosphingosinicella sp. TaxID=2823234 RepID=UPI002F27E07D
MSVAFRRESDEEHKEPRFEIPIPVGPNLVTPAGLKQIEARVAELEALVAAEGEETRLAEAKRDLRYWRTRLATAQLASPPAEGQAGIGSQVRFRRKGKLKEMRIVGDDEADPANGSVS